MKTSITAGLKGVEASDIEAEYLGSPALRKRLVELLMKKQNESYKKRISESSYDSPNWDRYQADGVGYERAINEIISLIL